MVDRSAHAEQAGDRLVSVRATEVGAEGAAASIHPACDPLVAEREGQESRGSAIKAIASVQTLAGTRSPLIGGVVPKVSKRSSRTRAAEMLQLFCRDACWLGSGRSASRLSSLAICPRPLAKRSNP